MGNWMTQMKAENRQLKKKVKELEKQSKQPVKAPEPITIIKKSKKEKVLRHKLHNLAEANREYEGIIDRFAGENESLRDGELAAQRAFDDAQEKRKIFKAKAIRVVRILNKILVDLPQGPIEKFKDSEDYPVFVKFYEKYLRNKPVKPLVNLDNLVKED